MGALSGIKVLDFCHYIAGPYCTQTLADHGADVIKIEPIDGDPSRNSIPIYENESVYYGAMNRNKRSIAINAKTEKGREIIYKLIKEADVLVTNYSVGVPEKLGIGYEQISKINPKIIMAHITGFGLTGPMKNNSAFDGIIQAMSGIAHLTGEKNGPPMKAGLFIADHIAAFHGTIGVLLALQSRSVTGKGQLVDVSMLDSMVSLLAYNLSLVSMFDKKPFRAGNRSTNVFATTFQSKDGYLYIAPLTEKMWVDFCKVIGRPEFSEEDSKFSTLKGRLKNYDELEKIVEVWVKKYTTEEITKILGEKGIACGSVNSIEDLFNNEQLIQREMLLEIPFKDTKMTAPGVVSKLTGEEHLQVKSPPSFAEHTKEVLEEYGFSNDEIDIFINDGVIRIKDSSLERVGG